MYNFILKNHKSGDQIQLNGLPVTEKGYRVAPVGWNQMAYTFTRNSKYYGLFPTFTAQMGFVQKAKLWLNNIFWSLGLNARIDITISAYNSKTKQFEMFIQGVGNMETISLKQFQTDLEVIDPLFMQDILNKDSIEFDYMNMVDSYSEDHTSDPTWVLPTFTTLRIYGLTTIGCPLGYVDTLAVYPFQFFNQIVGLMTGDQLAFYSSFFGKTTDKDENGDYYLADGPGAYMMITTGRLIRGYSTSSLISSFEKAFKSFDSIFNLGMTTETTELGKQYIIIETKEYFYDLNIVATIENPKDLEITFDDDWRINSIGAGYSAKDDKDNAYGTGEYNKMSSYSLPISFIDNKLELISEYRADGAGIQRCMDNPHSGSPDDTTENDLDKEIFIISSYLDGALLRSRNDHDIVITGDIYGSNAYINADITPARIIKNWGKIIRMYLDNDTDKSILFQKTDGLTKIITEFSTGETDPVLDCANIPITSLPLPYLSGYKANMSSPFGIDDILTLKANPFGLIKFWDSIAEEYRYGWIKEVSTEPIDKKTNWGVSLISPHVVPVQRLWRLKMLSGDFIQLLEGDDVLLLNQN